MAQRERHVQQVLAGDDFVNILHPFDYIDGLVFAVAAAPEIPLPDQWLIWVLAERGQLRSSAQADLLADTLLKLLKEKLTAMRSGQGCFPARLQLPEFTHSHAPLCLWLRGVLAAHSQLEGVWQHAWQQMQQKAAEQAQPMAKALKHCISMFTTFADIPLALQQAQQRGNHDLESKLGQIFQALPQAIDTYVELSGTLVGYLPNQFETFIAD